jgi:hypothetical protein
MKSYTYSCIVIYIPAVGTSMKDLLEKILGYGPTYLSVFGAVFAGPKNFIAQRRSNADQEWRDALLFLAISTALLAVMTILLQPAGKDVWNVVAGTAATCFLAVALGGASLRISWWLVGGRATAQSFFITYSYTFGVIVIILAAFQVLGVGIFKLLDHDLYARVVEANANHQSAPPDVAESTVFWVVMAINVAGFLIGSLWGFIAWGAYRQLNGLSKARSFVALMISGILSIPISMAVFLVGYALTLS